MSWVAFSCWIAMVVGLARMPPCPSIPAASMRQAKERVVSAEKLGMRTAGSALSGGGWNLWTFGDLGQWVEIAERHKVGIRVRAAGSSLKGVWPEAELVVVVAKKGRMHPAFRKIFRVGRSRFEDHRFVVDLEPGVVLVRLRFLNDARDRRTGEDRNLFVREIGLTGVAHLASEPRWWRPLGKHVGLGASMLRAVTNASIARIRMGQLRIQTSPGAQVKVRQLQHAFAFGTAVATRFFGSPSTVESRGYLRLMTDNFNAVVPENAMKWPRSEPVQGREQWEGVDRMLRYCVAKDMQVRGHCLFWAMPSQVPGWVRRLDRPSLARAVDVRAKRTTARFVGRIEEFDVDNEMLRHSWYRNRLGAKVVARMFEMAAEGNPRARLYVNDHGILTQGNQAFAYGRQIQELLDRKAPLGGIGCQAHFDRPPDPNQVWRVLDYLSEFGLPITITEYDFGRGDEAEKARVLTSFFRVCFAHPGVRGIYQWGFWSGAHWKPERALWGKEGKASPAAEVYRDLVYHEWWTRFDGKADARGWIRVPAFFGKHRVESGGKSKIVTLERGQSSVRVSF